MGTRKAELEAWRTRSLAELDILGLYLDALALRIPSAGKVVSVARQSGPDEWRPRWTFLMV